MERSRLLNILLVLLITIAALYLVQMLLQVLSIYADILLLFLLGWLVSFILNPLVVNISQHPIPMRVLNALEPVIGAERAKRWALIQISRGAAVAVVYFTVVLLLVLAAVLFVPVMVLQLSELAKQWPEYIKRTPELSGWVQDLLARFGIYVNVDVFGTALATIQTIGAAMIQNVLGIFTGLLGVVASLFFVLIISFYFTVDSPRLRTAILDFIPDQYQQEMRFFGESVNRTFGGFVRGQLLQAFLVGLGTAVVMALFNLNFVLVASLFATLFMLIPLVGPYLALVPPLAVVLIESPDLTLWVFIILFVYQFVLVNVVMPRVFSESVGLHPLLVFGAILFGIRIGGVWGAFFGIPVAGVLWAMGKFFIEERTWERLAPGEQQQRRALDAHPDRRLVRTPAERGEEETPPTETPSPGESGTPRAINVKKATGPKGL